VNRKPKQQTSIMVRAAVVAFVLLAGLVMVGAAGGAAGGAEDQDGPRSSVLMTVVEEGRPVPVAVEAPRKLSKHSKASNDDAGLSKEGESLLRLLVFQTAVDLYRFVTQPARSLAGDETISALVRLSTYEEYDCDGCLAFFAGTPGYSTGFQRTFCSKVSNAVGEKSGIDDVFFIAYTECLQFFTANCRVSACCQSLGVCRN